MNSTAQSIDLAHRPKVSVGMPVYNGQSYLREAIDSILSQTFDDFELFISDNGSTDQTFEICQQYAAADRRVRVVRQTENLGAVGNFNFVFRQTQGEYFKWAAADDVLQPAFLQHCVEALDRDPGAAWCHCTSDMIDNHGQSWLPQLSATDPLIESNLEGKRWWKGHPRLHHDSDSAIKRFRGVLLGTNWSADSYGLFRRSELQKTRVLVPLYGAEKVMLAELSLYGRYIHLPELLFSQRIHLEASGNLDSREKQEAFAASGSKRPFLSSRLAIFQSHLFSVWRSPLLWGQKAAGLQAVVSYLFQFGKWGRIVNSAWRRQGVGGDGKKMMDRAKATQAAK